MKTILYALLVCLFAVSCDKEPQEQQQQKPPQEEQQKPEDKPQEQPVTPAEPEEDPNDLYVSLDDGTLPWQVAQWLGMGWNLGNQFDAHNNGVAAEDAWGNPKVVSSLFPKLKQAGFSTVRIPVTWLGHIGAAPEYKIDDAWLNRLYNVVGYAQNAGLNVIINIHHDGSESKHWLDIINAAKDPERQQQILAQITAVWTQIAEKFKAKNESLVFEGFNEIHDGKWGWGDNRNDGGKQYACMNEWNQAFVNAVRATGGNNATRYLGVPAYCTNVDLAIESFVMPEDVVEGKLLLSVHSYDPSDYTLNAKYSQWGHTATASLKPRGDNEAELKALFEKIYTNFISKGVPVYMGEFGCVNRATELEQKFQQYYLKYYARLAKIYGVPCMLWDNGSKGTGKERHAFIDRTTGNYSSDGAKAAVEALIKSYNSKTSLEALYNVAPANEQ